MDRVYDSPKGRAGVLKSKGEIFQRPLNAKRKDHRTTCRPKDHHEAIHRRGGAVFESHRETPFFLYLAHNMPHVPLFRSKAFENKSLRGLFGDVVEEVDWSVGQVLDTLRKQGLEENTFVLFTATTDRG